MSDSILSEVNPANLNPQPTALTPNPETQTPNSVAAEQNGHPFPATPGVTPGPVSPSQANGHPSPTPPPVACPAPAATQNGDAPPTNLRPHQSAFAAAQAMGKAFIMPSGKKFQDSIFAWELGAAVEPWPEPVDGAALLDAIPHVRTSTCGFGLNFIL